jgi:hypothetical protein
MALRELVEQEGMCRQLANRKGLRVRKVFKDKPWSRTSALHNMKEYCKTAEKKIEFLIVVQPKILSKYPEHFFQQMRAFEALGVEIVFAMNYGVSRNHHAEQK